MSTAYEAMSSAGYEVTYKNRKVCECDMWYGRAGEHNEVAKPSTTRRDAIGIAYHKHVPFQSELQLSASSKFEFSFVAFEP
jgi:hypothetical protein